VQLFSRHPGGRFFRLTLRLYHYCRSKHLRDAFEHEVATGRLISTATYTPGLESRHELVSELTAMPPSPPARTSAWSTTLTRARPALLAFVPLVLWILLFSSGVALIPPSLRPPINTTLLPRIDALVGYSHTWFAARGPPSSVLDVAAAIPYTVHTLIPFAYLAAFLRPVATGTRPRPLRLLTFFYTFGLMNLAAVSTHLLCPTAPPWYFVKYGTSPANYSMKGDPALLARVDALTGSHFFRKMYRDGGKVVFGTWPSLHAAWPYLVATFRPAPFPRAHPLRIAMYLYVAWVWWAAIYLQHHYLADVLGGALYAEAAMYIATPRASEGEPTDDEPSIPILPIISSNSHTSQPKAMPLSRANSIIEV
jgi:membrane-associated phospholipid phosphatase